ncbi:Nin one binding Zn-ribbon like-domain-containing protein [Lasiosphaeria miniovina]|uniref:20S-pre-rRNA D-site endonuclease NOB1 n=1 Tax=Lasiosphaeria miniovina TaxID=1954250 RepID=A0AA40B4Y0_9PEZI|nr:Nin one binding Zn-ribbon like-domain-containing protein [Lasiosphaeria miniovina]KAK0727810.1 Nin one binding Zn-ribbon like-domain-containing protein [Lasiosphaeria miniovina]
MEQPATEPATEPVAQAVEVVNPAPATALGGSTHSTTSPIPAPATPAKAVHCLVLDANAIIKNDPTVSTLIAQADELYTIPAVVAEIRDEATRSRFEITLRPFLKIRTPRPESVQFVTSFARRTGDLQVLSAPDLHLLALTYDLELEKNGGDWRLRREPNQKTINGKPPGAVEAAQEGQSTTAEEVGTATEQLETGAEIAKEVDSSVAVEDKLEAAAEVNDALAEPKEEASEASVQATTNELEEKLEDLDLSGQVSEDAAVDAPEEVEGSGSESEENDGAGEWITPSNIKKHQARENTHKAPQPIQRTLKAALITADMAMRHVALRINLNLLDTGFSRITYLKTWVLRCHGCWKVCKDMSKQFCPSCGQPTLTRVSCSTDASGNFKLHLKQNFQYNNRGNVYSIPKPTHGSASGKLANVKGGGKQGWGSQLILAEDQKEYSKILEEDRRTRYRDLMDEDYLPSILTGSRNSGHGRPKVGAPRNVNANKRG